MADIADRADTQIENTVADALREARRAPSLIAAGFCHYCGEAVANGMLFCDTQENECAKDWHHEQARKKANGTA